MLFVGIDPSFTRTGLALYRDGVLRLTHVDKEKSTDKDYQSIFHRVDSMSDRILEEISSFGILTKVISEEPLPSASFSSGLFALDTVLFHKMIERYSSLQTLYNVHPSYLTHVHGKRGYIKTDSVILGKKLIEAYESIGIKVDQVQSRLANDTAEALIFLTRLLVVSNVSYSGKFVRDAVSFTESFTSKKEKILYSKECS